MRKVISLFVMTMLPTLTVASSALAEGPGGSSAGGLAAVGAGIAVGVAALGCGLGQGKAVGAALDSIGRNPSASGKILTPMVLGLVFMETLTIFSFVIAFFLQGKV